ncbi:MAG: tetratricopeptide repeat protein [Parachlamydiaceae bacterium]|nr:tetratricopeptide repeat protein [Parachlamydiaceae bacterium]
MRVLPAIIYCLCFLSLPISATPNCCTEYDLQGIRYIAANSIDDAHRNGGNLFRQGVVWSSWDAAWSSVYYRKRYTEFSATFRRFIAYSEPKGLPWLYQGYSEVGSRFNALYTKCIDQHSTGHTTALYERGRIYFDNGLYTECLSDIQAIDDCGKLDSLVKDISLNELLFIQGLSLIETNAYDEAIIKLSELIRNDPQNKEAYFNRAIAYFETGDFDEAINDFRTSEKSKSLSQMKSKVSTSFTLGLMEGLKGGGSEAVTDFVPSLWQTVHGMGTAIWVFAEQPISCSHYYANACYDAGAATVEYLKTLDYEKCEGYAEEVKLLWQQYDVLKDDEKGKMIGYVIGKYGTDFLITGGTLKGLSALQNLKAANRVQILETLAASPKSKEALISSSLAHCEARKEYFRNVKYNFDSHNKHVLGHKNYDGIRSVFTHPHPEKLLKNFGGTGVPHRGIAGDHGFKETIDFKEIIGIWKSKDGTLSAPTTRGTIHYGGKGGHIVPVHPTGCQTP